MRYLTVTLLLLLYITTILADSLGRNMTQPDTSDANDPPPKPPASCDADQCMLLLYTYHICIYN